MFNAIFSSKALQANCHICRKTFDPRRYINITAYTAKLWSKRVLKLDSSGPRSQHETTTSPRSITFWHCFWNVPLLLILRLHHRPRPSIWEPTTYL
ncbi:hypothetical protein AVEN_62971-1 [Araneus ventricosus]|uniref:Uncharacterized protein n=1 Tax=Araneus ventricosus TaxID=182803 RepID=A0A4Y2KI77_ARAVE|nr:hypothetical protein AVEN_62971-1 [Araneus ventricosus]